MSDQVPEIAEIKRIEAKHPYGHSDVQRLLAHIDALQAENERLKAALREIEAQGEAAFRKWRAFSAQYDGAGEWLSDMVAAQRTEDPDGADHIQTLWDEFEEAILALGANSMHFGVSESSR